MLAGLFTPGSGDRPDVPDVCILLTDGEDTSKIINVSRVARAARARGIEVFTVGVTNKVKVATTHLGHRFNCDRDWPSGLCL